MVYYSMFYEFTVVDLYSTVIHFLKLCNGILFDVLRIYSSRSILNCNTLFQTANDIPKYTGILFDVL